MFVEISKYLSIIIQKINLSSKVTQSYVFSEIATFGISRAMSYSQNCVSN